jgi:hypothetical protein
MTVFVEIPFKIINSLQTDKMIFLPSEGFLGVALIIPKINFSKRVAGITPVGSVAVPRYAGPEAGGSRGARTWRL